MTLTKTMIAALCLVLAAGACRTAWAQKPGASVDGLKLGLETDKEDLKMTPILGEKGVEGYKVEPARLTLSFINTGRMKIKLIAYELEWDRITFNVTGPDPKSVEALKRKLDRDVPRPRDKDFPVIDPSRSWIAPWQPKLPGGVGPVSYKFLQPGEYHVTATYTAGEDLLHLTENTNGSWIGKVVSNEVVLTLSLQSKEAPAAPGAETAPPAETGKSLRIELVADKTDIELKPQPQNKPDDPVTYAAVTPVKLTVNLVNVGDHPFKLDTYRMSRRLIKLNVKGPDGESVRATELGQDDLKNISPKAADFPTLDVNNVLTSERPQEFPGVFGATDFTILKPGEYRLSVTYSVDPEELKNVPLAAGCWSGTVTSEEIVIKAVVPEK